MAVKGRAKIFTHLWYAKEAEEAARYYASIFPRLARRARHAAAGRVAERPPPAR